MNRNAHQTASGRTAPWLSVIVPTYNGERYLAECLGSIVQSIEQAKADTHSSPADRSITSDSCQSCQRLQPRQEEVEVLVVDDGSTDGTRDIARSFSSSLNLTLHGQPHTGRWTGSTNHGMSLATGTYTCWLHQDDRWEPDRLPALRRLADRFPTAGLLLSSSWFISPEGERLRRWTCPLPPERALPPDFVLPRLLIQCFVASCAPVFRTDLARACGPLDESLWFLADWDFWLRLASRTDTVTDRSAGCGYRIHPAAQTVFRSNCTADLRRQYDTVLQKYAHSCSLRLPAFSAETNLALFRGFHQGVQVSTVLRLIASLLTLRPGDQLRYFRYSRLFERLMARRRFIGHQQQLRPPVSQPLTAPMQASRLSSESSVIREHTRAQ